MPNSERTQRLNGPMEARLRQCAADTSSNWAGKITIYPPEARELVALVDEVRRLRSDLETMTHVAQGNKRHVADLTYQLERVEALTKDGAGADLNGAEIVVAGKIRRALYDPLPDDRPNTTCSKCGSPLEPCVSCGKPSGCGEVWCAEHGPRDDEPDIAPNPADRPACYCCGRQVAPLDSDQRCGHCGPNRPAGTHVDDLPCRITGSSPRKDG